MTNDFSGYNEVDPDQPNSITTGKMSHDSLNIDGIPVGKCMNKSSGRYCPICRKRPDHYRGLIKRDESVHKGYIYILYCGECETLLLENKEST